nr:Ribosomal protein S9 [Pedinophyceae sp. YPF-701]
MSTNSKILAHGLGRRKNAIAEVSLTSGTGKLLINGKPGSQYLQENPSYVLLLQSPMEVLGLQTSYDISIKVKGGGLSGQAGAIRLGLARAFCNFDETTRSVLKIKKFLSRDSRVKERRKYGLKKARKAPQFSKR